MRGLRNVSGIIIKNIFPSNYITNHCTATIWSRHICHNFMFYVLAKEGIGPKRTGVIDSTQPSQNDRWIVCRKLLWCV